MPNKKLNNTKMLRKNLNLPIELVSRVNDYSNLVGLNFTSSVIVLLDEVLKNKFEKNFVN